MAVTADGMDALQRKLAAMQERARDLSPVLEVAAADTVSIIDDAFESSTSPAGMSWEDLKPATKKRRRGVAPYKVLVDTGRLRGSVNSRVEGSSLKFGTNAGYGIFHQFGTSRMVDRPFLPIDGEPGSTTLGKSGFSAAHWTRVLAMIKRYILTGEVV